MKNLPNLQEAKEEKMSDFEKVRQQILNSLDETELDLLDNQLTNLPTEIGQLSFLTQLYLDFNKLTSLPTEIGQLHYLTELHLFNNQLTSLPSEIGQLHFLRLLNLGYNQLTNLPAEIGQLHSLTKLNLRWNQLTNLLAEIGQLHSLTSLNLNGNPIQDLSSLANHPNQDLSVECFGVYLPRRYWTHLNQWKAEWLLTEDNAEVRRVLIQQLGYDRILQELGASAIDQYREYTLLRVDANIDIEPIFLLKMTCPSTAHIHFLRVPPDLTSAREAIRWVNWDIDPEAFAVET
jgi:hypothetical protein